MDTTKEAKDLLSRRKILSIPSNEVLQSIYSLHEIENIICHKELPEEYIVKGVWHNYVQDTFDFMIIHPSFDVVLEGTTPPSIDDLNLSVQQYKVKKI